MTSASCVASVTMTESSSKLSTRVERTWDQSSEGGDTIGCARYTENGDIPATGVAGGIERLMISLERGNLFPKSQLGAKVFIATVQESLKQEAIKLAQKLRENGMATEVDLKTRPFGKQLEYANATRIPYLIVLGPQELQSQMVKVKDMATRNETEVPLTGLVEKLQSLN